MDEVLDARRARLRVRLGAVAVLVLVGLGCAMLVSALGDHGTAADVARPTVAASTGSGVVGGAQIFVHVLQSVSWAR